MNTIKIAGRRSIDVITKLREIPPKRKGTQDTEIFRVALSMKAAITPTVHAEVVWKNPCFEKI